MTLDLALIGSVAGQEAAKQDTDLVGLARLLDAYQWAYVNRYETLNKHWLVTVAIRIERERNWHGQYRKVPVTFRNVGSSANPQLIPSLIDQWAKDKHYPIEARVKELGWIHPFQDGNGRLMWIVRTRLTNTWARPEPLPDYFGV